ncbi:hypothetical protein [Thalassolituus marinus]|uniref:Uncharacterized protein n=1 Tax=Thalassolituus marinus TaxID=671053 RepID=A0ABS7ZYA2_9GAMM|nr:hypothetical protein [Thalassolituus marinus]MCA6065431.1 hypothetical protein [Thalassolituus marinus]
MKILFLFFALSSAYAQAYDDECSRYIDVYISSTDEAHVKLGSTEEDRASFRVTLQEIAKARKTMPDCEVKARLYDITVNGWKVSNSK